MKYAFGELVSTDTDRWLADFGRQYGGTFIVANPETIDEHERCDGNIFIFKFDPEDQFATHMPLEKVQRAFELNDRMAHVLRKTLGVLEQGPDWRDGEEAVWKEIRAIVEGD